MRTFIFIIIFINALFINSISPLMTTFQETFNISISQSSVLPFSNTLGNIIFATIAGFIISKIGLRKSLYNAFLFQISSLLVFIFSKNLYGLMLALFLTGGGLGQVFSVTTSMYDHLPENMQNYGLFHAFFGLGGIIGPLLVSIFLKYHINYKILFFIYLIIFISLFLYITIKKIPKNIKYKSFSIKEGLITLRKRIVLISMIMLIIYAGIEIGSITWAANLFKGYFNYSKDISALFIGLFWIAFTLGRIITDKLYNIFGKNTSLYIPLFASFSLLLIFILKSPFLFILYGLFLGPIFPATQKYLNNKLSHREVGLISGLIFAGTGIGSMLITTTMGIVADKNLFISYLLPFSFLILISFLSPLREKQS
ncbi:Fucose permease [Marinitoga hydrogenitolerans DSM 16785]|uniref:Fucose permease n=1 Tax=Marinitoga hydrogenitolerans (strain DSM 16785 / JCM 12826 / AT1271) TaxID=1122195 RepID=A0A1M4YE28_MARH1|nr:MFS transporter [Marinitoga hydrogenitolerans]SHF04010.1 Fucose permease [Marinitoga hydrogenitolerans DSM 16785]